MTRRKTVFDPILKERFGFDQFREGQYEAITTLLDEGRLLCIQPTGYGKSLLYQFPTVLLDGLTLVISPLLALMRDQISHLSSRFRISAASINSDQSEEENQRSRRLAAEGKLKILFVAPEQLDDLDRFRFLLSLSVNLLVIDEAHCISTWGHDFRPSYRQIIQLVHQLEKKRSDLKVLALTATANHQTENDIKKQLSTVKPVKVLRASMDRPNIQLSTVRISSLGEKLAFIEERLPQLDGDGLIYCATRENTEIVEEFCQHKGINAVAYHAGIDSSKKCEVQKNFIDGKYKVISATNALGMGIDKPDLRFIIHFDFPGSITAYYQEIGRAGRNGSPAKAILLFDKKDKKIQEHFIDSAQPTEEDFIAVLNVVSQSKEPLQLVMIKRMTGLHPIKVTVIVAELVEQDLLRKTKHAGHQCYVLTDVQRLPDLTRYVNQYQVRMKELKDMIAYSEAQTGCRMQILRHALGDDEANICEHCDLCGGERFAITQTREDIEDWISSRIVKIKAVKINRISEGVSVINGNLRSSDFINFMRNRSKHGIAQMGLTDSLTHLIKSRLKFLSKKYQFSSLIVLPSRTWMARIEVAKMIAQELKIPIYYDVLKWKELPQKRQGELLNNDQRRHNVSKKMIATFTLSQLKQPLLLLDDYIGSGATIKEAARALRKGANLIVDIIPFTIASVKWRLGKPGMI